MSRAKFDWHELLLLAWELNGQPQQRLANDEALQRTSVVSAYYATFILARNFLRDHDGIDVPRFSAHDFVSQQFFASRDRTRHQIGVELRQFRNIRTRCHYEDVVGDVDGLAQEALRRAERVLHSLESL